MGVCNAGFYILTHQNVFRGSQLTVALWVHSVSLFRLFPVRYSIFVAPERHDLFSVVILACWFVHRGFLCDSTLPIFVFGLEPSSEWPQAASFRGQNERWLLGSEWVVLRDQRLVQLIQTNVYLMSDLFRCRKYFCQFSGSSVVFKNFIDATFQISMLGVLRWSVTNMVVPSSPIWVLGSGWFDGCFEPKLFPPSPEADGMAMLLKPLQLSYITIKDFLYLLPNLLLFVCLCISVPQSTPLTFSSPKPSSRPVGNKFVRFPTISGFFTFSITWNVGWVASFDASGVGRALKTNRS